MPERDQSRRAEARRRTELDFARLRRREPGGGFWRSLSLIGSVGWPIVLLATGGALVGRLLDVRLATGVRFTLLLLVLGTAAGCLAAWRALRRPGS